MGGSHLVIKNDPRGLGNIPLMDIRYKYRYQKVLGVTFIEKSGSTEPGATELSHYPENYLNISIPPVVHPQTIGRNFSAYNTIDNQNMIY